MCFHKKEICGKIKMLVLGHLTAAGGSREGKWTFVGDNAFTLRHIIGTGWSTGLAASIPMALLSKSAGRIQTDF
jgi:hypothetical protein